MTRHDHDQNTTAPWARALSFPAVLRDGRRVRIRPITPADKARIVEAMGAMSARSRFLRFHAPRTGFTKEELRRLTELDFENQVAWGAIAEDEPGRPGIAAARFSRDPAVPDTADFSITVLDAWQRSGLGSLLLQTLLVSAAELRLRRLRGTVLRDNTPALRMFERFGAQRYRSDGDAVVVGIPVMPDYRTPRMSQEVLIRRPA
jgi:RimJ/RimL family protein N-acetyltransferase